MEEKLHRVEKEWFKEVFRHTAKRQLYAIACLRFHSRFNFIHNVVDGKNFDRIHRAHFRAFSCCIFALGAVALCTLQMDDITAHPSWDLRNAPLHSTYYQTVKFYREIISNGFYGSFLSSRSTVQLARTFRLDHRLPFFLPSLLEQFSTHRSSRLGIVEEALLLTREEVFRIPSGN